MSKWKEEWSELSDKGRARAKLYMILGGIIACAFVPVTQGVTLLAIPLFVYLGYLASQLHDD